MRSIYRILMDKELGRISSGLSGVALDLASGENPSYRKYLPEGLEFVSADLKTGVDFNKKLPFKNEQFDVVFLINAIYIARDRKALLLEVKRILKPGGKFVVVSPFIANEMPDPDDFSRLTYQGLERELKEAGFWINEACRIGERFSSAVYLLDPLWRFWLIKFPVYFIAPMLDKLIPAKVRRLHPTPLGYLFLAKK